MNLYTANLALDLTYEAIELFLRIGDPIEQRPQEGVLLDFNENVPSDLGDVVTAFSNTYGGLIILGVRERKGHQLAVPDEILGLGESKEAIHGKIVNIIWSTVQPRPVFSVGVVPLRNSPDKVIAVVRVEEGIDTPYMYTRDGKNKISVRIGDSNRRGSLEQIRSLFERSLRRERQLEENLATLGDLYVLDGVGGARSSAVHILTWTPTRLVRLRLDRQVETWVSQSIRAYFPRDRASDIEVSGTGTSSDFDAYNVEWKYHRKWRLSDRGALGFASRIGRIARPEMTTQEIDRVGDWILDALSFFSLVNAVAGELGYFGSGRLVHSLVIPVRTEVVITASTPTLDPSVRDNLRGVVLPERVSGPSLPRPREYTFAPAMLDPPGVVELVADSFLYHLRSLGGRVDWSSLCEDVRQLMGSVYSA